MFEMPFVVAVALSLTFHATSEASRLISWQISALLG
jgi:hypothetical protein